MITIEKLQLVNGIITQQVVYYYPYFKKYYKMIAIDLNKQQALDADPKRIQQINFTGNLDPAENTTMFFIFEEEKETILNIEQRTVRVL